MGLQHDRGTTEVCSGGYNYGYRDPDALFRTIMGYNCRTGQCDNLNGNSCSRVQRFSTSDTSIKYSNKALGTPAHDNARKLNEVKLEVSNYFTRPVPVPCSSAAECTAYDGIACYEAWCDDGMCGYNHNLVDGCCGYNKSWIQIHVITDDYPQETEWNLQSESGNTIDAMTGTSGDTSLRSEHICVDFGRYVFTITDSYGDGICCGYGEGSISISVEGDAPMVMSGAFKNEETQIIDVGFSTTTNPPSSGPSGVPSLSLTPSAYPTDAPSVSTHPSATPSILPSNSQTSSLNPTELPSLSSVPSSQPSANPSYKPSVPPSEAPSGQPSPNPSYKPSVPPSETPSGQPSPHPSYKPSVPPSGAPSTFPSSSVSCEEEQHFDHTNKKGKTKPCRNLYDKITKVCARNPAKCEVRLYCVPFIFRNQFDILY